MSEECLTDRYFPEGICIGCGPANPMGFQARFFSDTERSDQVVGRFTVAEHCTGLPGIAQGGVLFTVLDCLTAWTTFALRRNTNGRMPVGMGASINFHKPARIGQKIELIGTIAQDPTGPRDPMITRGEARDEAGVLLADMETRLAMLPLDTFKRITGITELPEHYRELFPDA